MGRWVAIAAAAIALGWCAPQALAFDTAPHLDITGDALTAEGFGRDAVRLAQVNNWFVDLYVNAKATPQSGHAPWWKTLLGARWYLGEIENWNTLTVQSSTKMHSTPTRAAGATGRSRISSTSGTAFSS